MDFKKCSRCGCFFISNNDVCCNCEHKDMLDVSKLTTLINDNNTSYNSIYDLSISSGISVNNLNRLIQTHNIDIDFKL